MQTAPQPPYLAPPDPVEQLAGVGQVHPWPRWDEEDTSELPRRCLPFRVRNHLTSVVARAEVIDP